MQGVDRGEAIRLTFARAAAESAGFGRLADGAGWQDAAAELAVVSARFGADQPTTHAQLRTRVRAFAGRTPGDPVRLEDLLIHAIVLLVLGAVSANVATLIFARTAMRESEMVVRHALGASRARVVAQVVTESLVLALAAALLGLVVAQTTVRYVWDRATQIMGESLPFWVDLTLEPASIGYALLLALVAAALIGLLPALKATGVSVQRGLQGLTSAGGTINFGGISRRGNFFDASCCTSCRGASCASATSPSSPPAVARHSSRTVVRRWRSRRPRPLNRPVPSRRSRHGRARAVVPPCASSSA